MEEKRISKAVITRMPRYYRYLGELMDEGVERISSKALSEKMHITASQIRQDFNNFGGFGQQGYGYNVRYLHEEIGKILALDTAHNVVIIGIGNIGHALAAYMQPDMQSFHVSGIFDADPNKVGRQVGALTIRHIDELDAFVKENSVDIAVLTVPRDYAIGVAEKVVSLGIKAIWNFALIDLNLKLPKGVVVENVHLMESLMRLSYNSQNTDGFII
ncbi:MAG: redox-sensing transcriptional repressor Rex [Lachnospiraceae bacterium]|nr:redox-sensing transcriptional repressor Rex [Lachnospiraceae bacterium]